MKSIIICFSRSGKTLKVAESLKSKIRADFIRIEPVKPTDGVIGYIIEAYNSVRNKNVPIKPMLTDLSDYDTLIFCCPVFAQTTPGAVKEYLEQMKNYSNKKYAIILTSSEMRPEKASVRIKKQMDKENGQFIGMLRIHEKEVKEDEYEEKVLEFSENFK